MNPQISQDQPNPDRTQVDPQFAELPEAEIHLPRHRISVVWLVPLVAAIIGGWLAYKAISEKGPAITITFKSAEGLEADETKVRYKNVELGVVTAIDLSEDLSHVVVTAELIKGAEKFLSENTRFWVVRARVDTNRVSGLGTLFSGVYITLDPGDSESPSDSFKGLEQPPIVTTGLPGKHYTLKAEQRGSLDIGSPVFYRQISVGQIVAFHLQPDGRSLEFTIFVHAPYDQFVRRNSRFWNASGVDLKLDAEGIRLNTVSLGTMLQGGIAFDLPGDVVPAETAPALTIFNLYKRYDDISKHPYTEKEQWLMYFDSSVRGLSPGAPVEFRGIRIGQVKNVSMEIDFLTNKVRIPVLVETEPQRILTHGDPPADYNSRELMEYLVAQGLRGQLETGNLLTGQLFVGLDFHPQAEPATIQYDGEYMVFPTVKAPWEAITQRVVNILAQIEKIPFEQIGANLSATTANTKALSASPKILETMENLGQASTDLRLLLDELRAGIAPEIGKTLTEAQRAVTSIESLLASDSPLQIKLKRAMDELSAAARSFRFLSEYLERHPESLIQGKGDRD